MSVFLSAMVNYFCISVLLCIHILSFDLQYLQCFVVVILLADLTLCSSLYLFEKLAQAQGLALKESDHPSAFVWDSPGL